MGRITQTRVAVAIVNMITANVAEKQIYFDAWTSESEVNLALMGLWLRKLRDFAGGAIAYRGRSLISAIALFSVVL